MIDGISIKEGATYTPSGGTTITFDSTGEQVANGKACHNAAETDFYQREKLVVSTRQPTVQSDGDLSKGKNSARIIRPYTLASGKVVYNLVRIEIESHPEAGSAEVDNLLSMGVDLMLSSDADNFFKTGSIT